MDNAHDIICEQASRGEALGDMCIEMCEGQTVKPVKCQAGHEGKEVVFEATFRDIEVFVKARTVYLENDSDGSVFWTGGGGEKQYPDKEQFTMMVNTHLSMNLNLSIEGNVLFKLWPNILNRESFSEHQNEALLANSMKNIWTLIMDNEYVFTRIFKQYDVFPELFGSCGGAYIVEKLRPLDMPYYLHRVSFQGWVERVRLGLAILDLVEELESMFDYPVHLCDVKSEHFGLSDHGRVKFLDVDNVYLKPIVDKTVGDGTDCEKHSDCDLFDCRGRCDLVSQKCAGEVVNNNLQVVCQKIFLGDSLGFKFLGGTGLLASRHASKSLQQALQSCSNPSNSKDGTRLRAEDSTFQKLYSSLKEAISIQDMLNNHV
eukprot:GFUD01012179.1.p1 GENE.GFUD01012179.1~~GFUD01012179.1.p1  ORF type:complete len:373 (+),score=96.41 GFUD01012179.1:265-1383(+)